MADQFIMELCLIMKGLIAVLFFSLLIQGCTIYAEGTPFAKTEIKEGHGKLVVFRQYVYLNGAFHPTIIINGEEKGKVHNNGYLEYSLAPGEYTIGFSRATAPNNPTKIIVSEGEYTYLEFKATDIVGINMMGGAGASGTTTASVKGKNHFIQHDEKTALSILSNSKSSIWSKEG